MTFWQTAKRAAKIALGRELWICPQFRCHPEMHGSSYGGWKIFPDSLSSSSTVYSVGVGDDISFDLSLMSKYGLEIHAFDPTPRSIAWLRSHAPSAGFHHHPVGVAAYDGTMEFFAPKRAEHVSFSSIKRGVQVTDAPVSFDVRRVSTLMRDLGHTQLDLLKMDIEGGEYEVIPDILKAGVPVRQILVEFHHRFHPRGLAATRETIRLLNDHGFRLFAISARGEEFSFMHQAGLP